MPELKIQLDDMKNLTALANFKKFKHVENICICNVSTGTCLH